MVENKQIQDLLFLLKGDECEKAYKTLFMLMHESMTRFAMTILRSVEDTEEIYSDFFIKIWQKREELHEIENPKLYFFVGIKNMALNKLAQKKKQQSLSSEDWLNNMNSTFFNPEDMMLSDEAVRRIESIINSLPPKCRVIFKLVKEEGLKYAEVSKVLDISIKTVEAQMGIALRRIKNETEFKNEFPELHSILTRKK